MAETPLREACMAAHELYVELKSAGFGRGEAIELVARFIAAQAQNEQP